LAKVTRFWGERNCLSRRSILLSDDAVANSAHDERYRSVIAELRRARIAANLSQLALAGRLGRRQQFVSKYESGERRLDIIEFFDIAAQMDLDAMVVLKDLGLIGQ
jgi:ribosome-binding protein aMBF1 (putative translation factor)